ncbi:hypothetical protein PHYBOEH_011866 [Phytophthora boehmeriae]|uniref:RxLR effector protein n=1 Tax=Phytophthora boehmeriae TaxID=109152 RepID=A0A8T1VJL2_9STRA|nr:hypothetical protein PHYBOEH_011866 [Phytophthora boehmeriae]
MSVLIDRLIKPSTGLSFVLLTIAAIFFARSAAVNPATDFAHVKLEKHTVRTIDSTPIDGTTTRFLRSMTQEKRELATVEDEERLRDLKTPAERIAKWINAKKLPEDVEKKMMITIFTPTRSPRYKLYRRFVLTWMKQFTKKKWGKLSAIFKFLSAAKPKKDRPLLTLKEPLP